MGNIKQMKEIKEWLQGGIINNEQDKEEPLGCVPIE